jgi:hypothetical protein
MLHVGRKGVDGVCIVVSVVVLHYLELIKRKSQSGKGKARDLVDGYRSW